jgi:sugar lactone lactonase YvrE
MAAQKADAMPSPAIWLATLALGWSLLACAGQPATSAPAVTSQPATSAPAVTSQPATSAPAAPLSSEQGQGSYGDAGVDLYAQEAPEFPDGLTWLNTPQPLALAGLRGKVVLVDFWTYGCINCIHNLPDLERLAAEHPDELVIIGVHSGKFTGERDTESLRQTVVRYGMRYPVINDDQLTVWRMWNAQAWPTLVVVDALGTMAGLHVGEGAYRALKPLIVALVREAEQRGRLNRAPLATRAESAGLPRTLLSFPAAVLADEAGGRLFIADTNHHRIVVTDLDGTARMVIGSGARGMADGALRTARFAAPQGMVLSADGVTLYIADAGNHAIRAVDLQRGTVRTLIGTGARAERYPPASGVAPDVPLSSPVALALDGTRLLIAMAGSHQIWRWDPTDGIVAPWAGSAVEGIVDGRLPEAQLAQPGALARGADGTVYFVDSESSTVRRVRGGLVSTIAGGTSGLFAFGDVDGIGEQVRLQHPLGIASTDAALYIADTYNHRIKRVDPATGEVRRFVGSDAGWSDGAAARFFAPGGLSATSETLYVADTNNHAIRAVALADGDTRTLVVRGLERLTRSSEAAYAGPVVTLPDAVVAPGSRSITLELTLPDGYKVNDLAPSAVLWRSDGSLVLPADADRPLAGATFPLVITGAFGAGSASLRADLTIIYCAAETPALCLIDEVRLIQPIRIAEAGAASLRLSHTVRLSAEVP